MALELLEEAMRMAGKTDRLPSMLDVGTGTGVLAIAAKALGAEFTVGLDVDPAAVYAARRNIALNAGCAAISERVDSSIQLMVGGLECIKGVFDIVAANLAAPTLLTLRDRVVAAAGSLLILSGIADAMADDVVRSYSSASCFLVMRARREEWNAALFQKRGIAV